MSVATAWNGRQGVVAYRRTPEFDEHSLPAGLTREHSTKLGVWGRIEVVAGALCYIVAAPINRSFRIEADPAVP